MEPLSDEILDYPRRDLVHAVQVAMARHGDLLTAGEAAQVAAFQALDEPAASLYARLLSRQPRVFRLPTLSYAEIPDIAAAADALEQAAFAWRADRVAPTPLLLDARTVVELKALCRELGLPSGGRRGDLLERLATADCRPLLLEPSLILRHRGLFRRLCRMYLYDHVGDLSRLVVARLGHVHYPAYTPTGGAGLWTTRAQLRDYEAGIGRLAGLWDDPAGMLADLPRAVASIEATPHPDPVRVRFSGRRFDEIIALEATRTLEREGRHHEAAGVYERLLAAGLRRQARASRRHALTLDALGRAADGVGVCARAREDAPPVDARQIDRTGRRLARKAGVEWSPLPPLASPATRVLALRRDGSAGVRPAWVGTAGQAVRRAPVEDAVVQVLAAHGRVAVHGENGPWTTLFGLLFRDALFAPIPGMLPTPLLTRPLDLGTPAFYANRRDLVDARLDEIAQGGAPEILARVLDAHAGEAIAGVHWDLFTPDQLTDLARAVHGPALAALLGPYARTWRQARRGMPDLCVLPGPAVDLEGLDPAPLAAGLLLVEVKGPTDSLRDEQRIWLDRLLAAGVRAEVWKVVAAAEA